MKIRVTETIVYTDKSRSVVTSEHRSWSAAFSVIRARTRFGLPRPFRDAVQVSYDVAEVQP